MITSIFLLIVGFTLLVKGADFLVDGASLLAKRLKVSDLLIGLTVVAFGTSAPELFVNIFASIQGNTDIAIGNILGSNTFNILVALGISALIYPLRITERTVWKEIPLSLFAAVLVGIMANVRFLNRGHFSSLTKIDGFIMLSFFVIFIYYILETAKNQKKEYTQLTAEDGKFLKIYTFILLGLGLLVIGAKMVVKSSVDLVAMLGISESLMGLTVVAAGTSLPELATSAIAAHKKNADIAVGNIVGSNIFNIFFILGVSSIIRPLPFSINSNLDISVTIFASLALFLSTFTGKRKIIDRWEGILFVVLYICYITVIVIRR